MRDQLLEIACFNAQSALIAAANGAQRIELCSNKEADGLSPAFETCTELLPLLDIPVNIMIRPRAGNFCYTEAEFLQMQNTLQRFKLLPINGFVFGILNEDTSINIAQNAQLIKMAQPLPCTFHKAFDVCDNLETSLETLIQLGFKNVLTSGGAASALEGVPQLKQLNEHAQGKINILVGGSVRSNNLENLKELTGVNHFHSSAINNGSEICDAVEVQNLRKVLEN